MTWRASPAARERARGANRRRYGYISVTPAAKRALSTAAKANGVSDVRVTTALIEAWLDEAEGDGSRDLLNALFDAVESAGGAMTLHGKPIDRDGLRAAAEENVAIRLVRAAGKYEMLDMLRPVRR